MKFQRHKQGAAPMNVMVPHVDEAPMVRESLVNKTGFPAGFQYSESSVDSLRIQNLVKRAQQPLPTSWAPPEGHRATGLHPSTPCFLVLDVLGGLLPLGFCITVKLRSLKASDFVIALSS